MTVKPDPHHSGKYFCRADFYDISGKRRQKYRGNFPTKREAKAWGESVSKAGSGKAENYDKIRLKDFLSLWLEARSTFLETGTQRIYRNHIVRINRYLGDVPLVRLNLPVIQKAVSDMSQESIRGHPATDAAKKALTTLHNALEYAVKAGFLDRNPAQYAERPRTQRYVANIWDAPTVFRALRLLKEQDEELYVPALLAMLLGLRRGEALGLSWENVDFEQNIIRVRAQFADQGDGRVGVHKKLKTANSPRDLYMSSVLAHELKILRDAKLTGGRIDPYVCSIHGSILNPATMSTRWGRFVNRNKLPDVRFHDLRHTFASLQLELGTDIKTISSLLGHCDLATTANIYLHPSKPVIAQAMDKIEMLVFGRPQSEQSEAE
jgi:integrase